MEKSVTLREFVSFLYHRPYKNVIKGNLDQIRVSLNGNDVDLACSILDVFGESFGKYLKVHAPELKAFYYSTDKLPNQIRYYIGEKDCTVAQFHSMVIEAYAKVSPDCKEFLELWQYQQSVKIPLT